MTCSFSVTEIPNPAPMMHFSSASFWRTLEMDLWKAGKQAFRYPLLVWRTLLLLVFSTPPLWRMVGWMVKMRVTHTRTQRRGGSSPQARTPALPQRGKKMMARNHPALSSGTCYLLWEPCKLCITFVPHWNFRSQVFWATFARRGNQRSLNVELVVLTAPFSSSWESPAWESQAPRSQACCDGFLWQRLL